MKPLAGTAFASSGRTYEPRTAKQIVLDNLTEDAIDAKMSCERGHMFTFKNGQAKFALKYGGKIIAVKQTGLELNVVDSRDDLIELIDAVAADVHNGLYDTELDREQQKQRARMDNIRAAWNALSKEEKDAKREANAAKAAEKLARTRAKAARTTEVSA